MKQYVQTDLEADRQVANTLAALILGGTLISAEVTGDADPAGNPDGGEPGKAASPRPALQIRLHRASRRPLP